jgi:hypothetical protein
MGLEIIDGFEQYGAPNPAVSVDALVQSSSYNFCSGSWIDSKSRYGRGASIAFHGSPGFGLRKILSQSDSKVTFGAALFFDTLPRGQATIVCFENQIVDGTGYTQCGVGLDNEGRLYVFTGTNNSGNGLPQLSVVTQKSSERGWLPTGEWHYVEVQAIINSDPHIGQVAVKVDNNLVVVWGGNTTNSNGTQPNSCNSVYISAGYDFLIGVGTGTMWVDDLYIANSQGSGFNDFLGPVCNYTLFPASDASPNDLAVVGGTGGHYGAVKGVYDEDTSYVWTAASGKQEWYALDQLPIDAMLIGAVSLNVRGRKSAISSQGYQMQARWGAAQVNSPGFPLSTAYATGQFLLQNDPRGGGWSKAAVNALNIGFQTLGSVPPSPPPPLSPPPPPPAPPPPPPGIGGGGPSTMSPPTYANPAYSVAQLFFEDTFSAGTLDATKWTAGIGTANQGLWTDGGTLIFPRSGYAHGGFHDEYYTSSQVTTGGANGLALTAVPDTTSFPGKYNWKSGSIFTGSSLPLTGCFVQWRVMLPDMSTGAWPQLIFLGPNGENEFDLYSGGLNGPGGPNDCMTVQLFAGGNVQNQYNTANNLSSGWHIFGVEFVAGVSIKSYLDGVLIDTLTTGIPLLTNYELVFSLAMATFGDLALAQHPRHRHTGQRRRLLQRRADL